MTGVVTSSGGGVPTPLSPINVSDLTDTVADPENASAGVTFNSDGTITGIGNLTSVGPIWIVVLGAPYWIQVDVTAGAAATTGTTGSPLALTSNRSWTWNQTVIGTKTATISISIFSDAGGSNLVASVTGVPVSAKVLA